MSSLPLEVKALVVAEICHFLEPEPILSALSFVWPDVIPFIRKHRFNDIVITPNCRRFLGVLPALLDIINSAPEVGNIIRKVHLSLWLFPRPPTTPQVTRLVCSAVNLENLTLTSFSNYDHGGLMHSLRTCKNLTTLSIPFLSVHCLSDFLEILSPIPRLTTLRLQGQKIKEFYDIANDVWANPTISQDHGAVNCPPWDTQTYPETPQTIPQITNLSLYTRSKNLSDLLLLDLLSSPKTPFPNVHKLEWRDHEINSHRTQRLSALLATYRLSLRSFHLLPPIPTDAEFKKSIEYPSTLTLPPSVDDFMFPVGPMSSVEPFCHALSSSAENLRTVTICLWAVDLGLLCNVGRLDEVLAGIANLETLDIEVEFNRKRCDGLASARFPRCVERYEKDGIAGGIHEKQPWFPYDDVGAFSEDEEKTDEDEDDDESDEDTEQADGLWKR